MSRSNWVRVILAVWLGLVIAVSISPLSFKLKLHTTGALHAVGHYVVYTLTGILLWVVAKRWFGRVFTFVLGVAIAFGQEWLENRLYHAGFEWRDIKSDAAGLVTGYALMILILALGDEGGRPG